MEKPTINKFDNDDGDKESRTGAAKKLDTSEYEEEVATATPKIFSNGRLGCGSGRDCVARLLHGRSRSARETWLGRRAMCEARYVKHYILSDGCITHQATLLSQTADNTNDDFFAANSGRMRTGRQVYCFATSAFTRSEESAGERVRCWHQQDTKRVHTCNHGVFDLRPAPNLRALTQSPWSYSMRREFPWKVILFITSKLLPASTTMAPPTLWKKQPRRTRTHAQNRAAVGRHDNLAHAPCNKCAAG